MYIYIRTNFILSARRDLDGPRRRTAILDLPMNGGYGKSMWARPVANTVTATVAVDIRSVPVIKGTRAQIACMIDSLIL